MSKQLNNDIELAASPQETRERVMSAFTDPARKYRSDPGHPEVCNVYHMHQAFNSDKLEEISSQCRTAAIGCVDCKQLLAQEINSALEPFREKRSALSKKPEYVKEVIADGARRAQAIAKETIREAKEKIGLVLRA